MCVCNPFISFLDINTPRPAAECMRAILPPRRAPEGLLTKVFAMRCTIMTRLEIIDDRIAHSAAGGAPGC